MKKKANVHRVLRHLIQIGFFLWMPALYTSAFSGIAYVVGQIRNREPIAMNGFLAMLLALCMFTIVFGRFFCGYACAFGSLGDGMHALAEAVVRKITKKKRGRLPWFPAEIGARLHILKYIVLTGLLAIYSLGIAGHFAGTSPWEVFSLLYNGSIPGMEYAAAYGLFLLILIGMCMKERFFCQYLCPMGAVFAWLPVLPLSLLERDRSRCIKGCRACQRKCPVDMEIKRNQKYAGECIHCLQCMDVCPKQNIYLGWKGKFRGNEILFVLLKAALLIMICLLVS